MEGNEVTSDSTNESSKELVEFAVRANPRPSDLIFRSLTNCAILSTNPDRPSTIETFQFLES